MRLLTPHLQVAHAFFNPLHLDMVDTEVIGDTTGGPRRYVSYAELQRHANRSSLWVLISGIVYDVTSLLSSHPGGTGPLLKYAGKDATCAYTVLVSSFECTDRSYGCVARRLCQYTRPTPLARCRTRRTSGPSTWLQYLAL
jgi:hypothetical protein